MKKKRSGKEIKHVYYKHFSDFCNRITQLKSLTEWNFEKTKAGEGGGVRGAKIPGARSAQRGPEISVNVRIVYHYYMFVLNEIRLLAHYPLIVVIDRKTYQM